MPRYQVRGNLLLIFLLRVLPEAAGADPAGSPPPAAVFEKDVKPFLAKNCTGCHGGEKPKGDLALDAFPDAAAAVKDRAVWDRVLRELRSGRMPPPNRPRPAPRDLEAAAAWIQTSVFTPGEGGARDPGRVTLRRLNSYEYNYTIRDLVGLDLKLADDFPADDVGYGFDNIGDVLTIPPLLMERYLSAAERIASQAIVAKPQKGKKLPDVHRRILFCEPSASLTKKECARQIVERFATRAYRRPAVAAEVARLLKLVDLAQKNGGTLERGVQLAVQAILVSPHFLFRVELDSKPHDASAVHPVTDYELASRLSYFLWSSMPDDKLFELAQKKSLREEGSLEKEMRRMLADPRSKGLVKTFSGQWLGSRKMKSVTPDPVRFPGFSEELREAMRSETELFFQEVLHEDLSVLVFLDSDFTFLNQRLARHYGIPGVKGNDMRRVTLEGRRRGGVLTQGTVLTVTSNPTRTSPVKRGRWILEQVLGTPPPPPPPSVDVLNEEDAAAASGSLRRRMEVHRKDPGCASCHGKMDPLGFALENYDAVGAWREKEGEFAVDVSASLPGGPTFEGAAGLKDVLIARKEEFCRALTEKMLTFALGRGLEATDHPVVDEISRTLQGNGYKFSTLILEIVKSAPFQMRRGERVMP